MNRCARSGTWRLCHAAVRADVSNRLRLARDHPWRQVRALGRDIVVAESRALQLGTQTTDLPLQPVVEPFLLCLEGPSTGSNFAAGAFGRHVESSTLGQDSRLGDAAEACVVAPRCSSIDDRVGYAARLLL